MNMLSRAKIGAVVSVLVTGSLAFASSLPANTRLVSFSTPVAASSTTGTNAAPGGGGSGYPVRPITWDDFKDSCKNPGQHQAQRPPENIKVVCRDQRWSWVLGANAGSKELPQSRSIGTELFSDKFHVAADKNDVCADGLKVGCPIYDQVELTFNLEESVSCEDVQNFAGSLTDFCECALNDAYTKNPGAYTSAPTGKSVDVCSDSSTGTLPTSPGPHKLQDSSGSSGLFNPNLN